MAELKGSILITGANGGFGAAIVSRLACTPELTAYHGIYTVRNANQPAPALDSALRGSGKVTIPTSHSFEKMSLDLSSLSSVRDVATDIRARVQAGTIPPLRAIVLNAGVEEFATQTWRRTGWIQLLPRITLDIGC